MCLHSRGLYKNADNQETNRKVYLLMSFYLFSFIWLELEIRMVYCYYYKEGKQLFDKYESSILIISNKFCDIYHS